MTCDEHSHKIDSALRSIAGQLGALQAGQDRVETRVEGLCGDVVEVREMLATARERVEDNTKRIVKLERSGAVQAAWRAKLGGAWMAIAISGGVLAVLAGIAVALFK